MGKVFLVLALLSCVVMVVGCSFTDKTHNLRHWKAFKQDLEQIHRDFDRFFLNYDETDPFREF